MGQVWFIGDTHIGHRNIGKYRSDIGIHSEQDNMNMIAAQWDVLVKKRDIVWVLGDACFTEESVEWYTDRPGRKNLILGNHDINDMIILSSVFDKIQSSANKYKHFTLSHIPICQHELRGKINIHAHVHQSPIPTGGYINTSCDYLYDQTGCFFLNLEDIRSKYNS